MRSSPKLPHAREFNEIEQLLKKLQKKLKQLEIEGITLEHFPDETQKLFTALTSFSAPDSEYTYDRASKSSISDNIEYQ